MNKNYLIYDKITLNQSYESLLTMTHSSYSHAHVYFCTLPSSNLFSFVSCDTIDDEDHILWPKWKHISPSAEHNYATAIKSNGEVNGMLYLTAVLHDPPFKNLHANRALRRRSSDSSPLICVHMNAVLSDEGNTVAHWVQWVGFVHRLTFPKINGSVLVSCHQRPVAHLWKVHWNFTLIILFEVSDGFERKLCGRKAGLQKQTLQTFDYFNISRCVISMKGKKVKILHNTYNYLPK